MSTFSLSGFFLKSAVLHRASRHFEFGSRAAGVWPTELQMYFSGDRLDRRQAPRPIIGGGKSTGRLAGFDIADDCRRPLEEPPQQLHRCARQANQSGSLQRASRRNRRGPEKKVNTRLGADGNFTRSRTRLQGFLGRSVPPGRTGNDAVGAQYNC